MLSTREDSTREHIFSCNMILMDDDNILHPPRFSRVDFKPDDEASEDERRKAEGRLKADEHRKAEEHYKAEEQRKKAGIPADATTGPKVFPVKSFNVGVNRENGSENG